MIKFIFKPEGMKLLLPMHVDKLLPENHCPIYYGQPLCNQKSLIH